jgi:hypothetical protein
MEGRSLAQIDLYERTFAFEQKNCVAVVTSRLTGNFSGGPVDLRYVFRLERGKIAALDIIA